MHLGHAMMVKYSFRHFASQMMPDSSNCGIISYFEIILSPNRG